MIAIAKSISHLRIGDDNMELRGFRNHFLQQYGDRYFDAPGFQMTNVTAFSSNVKLYLQNASTEGRQH